MAMHRRDGRWLLTTARAVAETLKRSQSSALRIRRPRQCTKSNTDGWYVPIGRIGRNGIALQIWLDRFSGHSERKLYAGLHSTERRPLLTLIKAIDSSLWPTREIDEQDIADRHWLMLTTPITRRGFNVPVVEKHTSGWTYFGFYDTTRDVRSAVHARFHDRAVSFFLDVVASLPDQLIHQDSEVYPRQENRITVESHLRRERSQLLSLDCKLRDNYTCQVCGMRFEDVYGRLGYGVAEAHHVMPLSKLRSPVHTSIDDLVTVCANCHRVLHRMEGGAEDVRKLRRILRNRRRRAESR
jgi:5-methylcytosine-specific restriction endonuclease McrA